MEGEDFNFIDSLLNEVKKCFYAVKKGAWSEKAESKTTATALFSVKISLNQSLLGTRKEVSSVMLHTRKFNIH